MAATGDGGTAFWQGKVIPYGLVGVSLVYVVAFSSDLTITSSRFAGDALELSKLAGGVSEVAAYFFPNPISFPVYTLLLKWSIDYKLISLVMLCVLLPSSYVTGVGVRKLLARWGEWKTALVYFMFSLAAYVSCFVIAFRLDEFL